MIYVIAVIIAIALVRLFYWAEKHAAGISLGKWKKVILSSIIVFITIGMSFFVSDSLASFGDTYFYEKIEISPINKESSKIIYLEKEEGYDNSYKYINSEGEEKIIYNENIKAISNVKGEKAFIEVFRQDQKYNIWTFGYGSRTHNYEYIICLPNE